MDLLPHIANIKTNIKLLPTNPNFKAYCSLRQALMVKGMKPGFIASFIGKIHFDCSTEAVASKQFSEYMAAQADLLIALQKQFSDEFGDDQVFLDSASNIWIVLK
jgi:hypothetical protein